ncbi:MAG: TerB family tellurite resistance protein [Bacteroidota bacterium]
MKRIVSPKSSGMDYSTFYTELGRLAYAVARADGLVQTEEVDKICEFIGQEIENTGSASHNLREAVLGAGAEFNRLRKNNASAREAFTDFTGYLNSNVSVFDTRIKNLCLKVAFRIASANEGVNETESALIDKLKKKLESIN